MTEKNEKKQKIEVMAREAAEAEFDRFVDAMDIDADPTDMSDEDKKGLQQSRRTVVKAIMNGSLMIEADGTPVYTPRRSKDVTPIRFREPTGADLMEMDKAKAGADINKTFKILAAITSTSPARFANLVMSDLNVCSAVMVLFTG